ncbi:MAG TPA: hypothetical protein VI256_14755 [Roseiarcus sp.]
MSNAILATLAGERPRLRGKVDLAPLHRGDFLAPRADQDQQVDGRAEWVEAGRDRTSKCKPG